jgi:hypothetical protein
LPGNNRKIDGAGFGNLVLVREQEILRYAPGLAGDRGQRHRDRPRDVSLVLEPNGKAVLFGRPYREGSGGEGLALVRLVA